jgi:hypothetical protein
LVLITGQGKELMAKKIVKENHKIHCQAHDFHGSPQYTGKYNIQDTSVADLRCLSWIPDPNFSIPDPGSRVKKIPDPGSGPASKNLSIFNPKNCSQALGNMFRDFIPDPNLDFLPILDSKS